MSASTWNWLNLWIIQHEPDIVIGFYAGLVFIREKLCLWEIAVALPWLGLNGRSRISDIIGL